MKALARTLGILSLLLAVAAVGVPLLGVALLLTADSSALADRAAVVGAAVGAVGVVVAVGGFVAGRRRRATALPVIGGLTAVLVTAGFVVSLALV